MKKRLKKEHFLAVLGYQGREALIDKKLMRKITSKSLEQLIGEGRYRTAFCLALFSGAEQQQILLENYNRVSRSDYTLEDMGRLFGVFSMDETIVSKVEYI